MNKIYAIGITGITLLLLTTGTVAGVLYGPVAVIVSILIVAANIFSGIGGFLIAEAVESRRRVHRYRKHRSEYSLPYKASVEMILIDWAIISGSILIACLTFFSIVSWVLANFVFPMVQNGIAL